MLNECPEYDIEQSHGEAPAIMEFVECRVPLFNSLLSALIWPGVVVADRVLSMNQRELFDI